MADTKINGALFQSMVTEGALAITEQKEQINELNVFPVPDGDTGTNMSMTMTAAMNELAKLSEPTLAKAADTTASALLRGARGNSGVILSLLFRGMAKKLRETEAANGRDLALALREGVDTAYKAVMKPAEGTILTVSRVAAQKTVEQCQADDSLSAEQVLAAIVEHGRAALAETVHQNPVLEKAGVVDAGGFGFITILEGMLDAMRGIHKERTVEQPARAAANFEAIRDEDITFTYCTEFIAERKDKARNVGRLRAILNDIGDSLVVVEDDDIVKVHVHTDQPNKALEEGLKFGPLLTVKIENMREQHTAKVIEGTADTPKERVIVPAEKKYGFVAVAAGEGLKSLFTDLGADAVVQGGQTMNPSTEDMLNAIAEVNADTIYIFPNNKNIVLAANQARDLTEDKEIVVVPTKTIPQGITALISFQPDMTGEENLEGMMEAVSMVKTGQVTYAVRDTRLDEKDIHEGDIMGIGDHGILAVGKGREAVAKEMVAAMVDEDSEVISIYYGAETSEEAANKLAEELEETYPDCEVEVNMGGQPIYYYIISVE